MPTGATKMIQSTIVVVAPATAEKKSTRLARKLGAICRLASANNSVKTMTGSIAPSAVALTTFDGTSAVTQLANPGSCVTCATVCVAPDCAVERSAATASGESFMSRINGGTISNATTAATQRSPTNVPTVTNAIRPRPVSDSRDATPTKSSETTSGTIVIRIALTQS